MGKKVYAIKEGFDNNKNIKIENLIVDTWTQCLEYVKGVKGAKYKSFESIEAAKEYLNYKNRLLKKGVDSYPEEALHVYVDGSYNVKSKKYSYGFVAVRNNVVEYIESAARENLKSNIRQIAGELEGAIKAVEYALNAGDKKVVVFHDYEGIFHHATGSWERKEESSENYYSKMKKLFAQGIEVIFVKVDSHTGDFYNELVDECCKYELNISSDKIVENWLLSNKLKVINEKVKVKVEKLITKGKENIVIDTKNNINFKGMTTREEIIEIINKMDEKKQKEILEYIRSML